MSGHSPDSSIRRKTAWTAGLSAASFLATFGSTLVISYHFGTSAELDAYWAAFAVMNLLAFPLTPLREALVPEVYRHLQNDRAAASDYFSRAMSLILLVATGGMIIGWLFADQLAALSVSARQPEVREMAVGQLYYLAPVIVLMALSETTNAMLTAFNRVVFQGFARLVGALAALAVLGAFAGVLRADVLPVSLIAAQAVILFVQLSVMRRRGLSFRLTWPKNLGARFIILSSAMSLNFGLHQLYVVFEKHTLSFLSAGLVSSFQYAVSMTNVIITVIGVTLSSVLWPRFLQHAISENRKDMFSDLMLVWRLVLLGLGWVCSLVLLNSESLIQLIYERGAFDAASVSRTSHALQLAVFAAVPSSILLINGRVLVSLGMARSLLATGIATTSVGIVTLVIGVFFSSSSVAMLHWLFASLAGLIVQTTILFRACAPKIANVTSLLSFVVRWLIALLVSSVITHSLLTANTREKLSSFEEIIVSSFILTIVIALLYWLLGIFTGMSRLAPNSKAVNPLNNDA